MENYEELYTVGSGAFGVTFKVRNRITGEVLAMKCIPRGREVDEYVKREILNHRVLNHPNVIQFKEVVLSPTKLGIVMEFAQGGTLYDKVRLGLAFSEAKARTVFQKLIAGVSYVHSKRISHRDLKLENTLLANNNGLKICDFGFSKSSLLQSKAKTMVGTPIYWAPEIETHPEYDGKLADVWSCGVTLYVMLTREYPDRNKTNPCEISRPVSEECRHLLSRIFVVNPDERITIDEIKNHPWYLRDLPDDLTEEAQALYRNHNNDTLQSEEDIIEIVNQAKIAPQIREAVEEAEG